MRRQFRFRKQATGWIVPLLLVFSFRYSIAEPNVIPSGSMEPTILPGDRVLTLKMAYDLRVPFTHFSIATLSKPRRGDIIVFKDPRDGSTNLIKRLVGLPGDDIEVTDGFLSINGTKMITGAPRLGPLSKGSPTLLYTEDFAGEKHWVQRLPHDTPPWPQRFKVPEGHYFFMGDNRDNSSDSRVWGFVPQDSLMGRALFVWLSLDPSNGLIPSVRWRRFGHWL